MMGIGIACFVMIVHSFTDQTFRGYYWLGTHNSEIKPNPLFTS